jgi:hypothetical protein
MALVVKIQRHRRFLWRNCKPLLDESNGPGQHQLPVNIEDEAVSQSVKHDPAAGPVFVLKGSHDRPQRRIGILFRHRSQTNAAIAGVKYVFYIIQPVGKLVHCVRYNLHRLGRSVRVWCAAIAPCMSRLWWPTEAASALRLALTCVAAIYLAMLLELDRKRHGNRTYQIARHPIAS